MKLDVVELQVKNFNKSVEWYERLFKLIHKEENFAMFNSGKATLALYKGKKNCITLYFRSVNIEKSHTLLKNKGVNVSHFVYEENR